MAAKIDIRELSRNSSVLDKYDYVEIEDKKSKKLKGAFISNKLLKDVKEYILQKEQEKKQKELNEIMQFAGQFEIDEKFINKSAKEIRQIKALEKYAN